MNSKYILYCIRVGVGVLVGEEVDSLNTTTAHYMELSYT